MLRSPCMRRLGFFFPCLVLLAASVGCGARSGVGDREIDASVGPRPQPEQCNGLDDDLDAVVDDGFRDPLGRYVSLEHCGACGDACPAALPGALGVACALVEETPACVATACEAGFSRSSTGRCIPAYERLCLGCADDADCGDFPGARCAEIGGERRCAVDCALGCPMGYACLPTSVPTDARDGGMPDAGDGDAGPDDGGAELDGGAGDPLDGGAGDDGGMTVIVPLCVPAGGSCSCEAGERFDVACALVDPDGARCVGAQRCEDGVLSMCAAPVETCDEVDNDCNGFVDDGFRDERGAYSLDVRNCGQCGVDCTASPIPEGDLVCGGDPFAPRCVLDCPDARDGIDPGDRVDGDLDIATGCECTVSLPDDVPGPVRTSGELLDTNCDGADGIVVESFYVTPGGDDTGPGSPTRPLRTIGEALRRARDSIGTPPMLGTPGARPHIYVASGSYAETLELPDGVQLHGGYRSDFRALDPSGFRVEVRAPSDTTAPGGAALVARNVGLEVTVVEWMTLRGRDATTPGGATWGAYLLDPGGLLRISESELRAGVAGAGASGVRGEAGAAAMVPAGVGEPNRAAVEDSRNACRRDAANAVRGGAGGRGTCGGVDVSGGAGGTAGCPTFMARQPGGEAGRGPGGAPGGAGGNDSRGPIRGLGCSRDVCCGLADFTAFEGFSGPQPGTSGGDGTSGRPGAGCTDAFGRFEGDAWVGALATEGTSGTPGSGGGGGGAGGGSEYESVPPDCDFPDALGGGGGGGGAGGCGGGRGRAGGSGGPSAALLVRYTNVPFGLPTLRGVLLVPSDGGRGGDGGAGGDGALGEAGGQGGDIPREARSTPPLAGGLPGARGGRGGNGGPGGGGGGGCGGASAGAWITGLAVEPPELAAWRTDNTVRLGRGGAAGRGGGGGAAASEGVAGGAVDVVVR
jgi:hypothetical protein